MLIPYFWISSLVLVAFLFYYIGRVDQYRRQSQYIRVLELTLKDTLHQVAHGSVSNRGEVTYDPGIHN